MFICEKEKLQIHVSYMESLKIGNRNLREGRQELILREWNQHIRSKDFLCSLRDRLNHIKSLNRSKESLKSSLEKYLLNEFPVANYFSEHRIAVYTCVIGAYDQIDEPRCKPDNIDYYIITDQPLSSESMWHFLDVSHMKEELSNLTPIEQNRWYKMHPHLLFPDYDYSIYLDGNITPVTDLTEFVNRVGSSAIATHRHYIRDCVYQEAKAVLQSGKDNKENIRQHLLFLEEQGMPKEYGLADCSVIARKHHEASCVTLMKQWWKEFLLHSRRDQLSFPYVLFKNNLPTIDLMTLGPNRIFNDALNIKMHI